MRTANALVRLCICRSSPKSSLAAYATHTSTKISITGSFCFHNVIRFVSYDISPLFVHVLVSIPHNAIVHLESVNVAFPGPKVIKPFSCSN